MKKLVVGISMAFMGVVTCLGGSAYGQALSTPSTNAPSATAPMSSAPSPSNGQTNVPHTGTQAVVPASAPASSNPNQEMAPIIVTGSMIPTTAGEVGPTPVDYVTGTAITKTDSNNIYDSLKRLDPDFQGGSNFGQELDNNALAAGESHIFLRNLPTLILLDGNRITNSPLSNGSAVNVNLIPNSFIDHIEVLKDGASTLYGEDAVSGVINIITKQNFTGVEVNEQYGLGGDAGGYFSDKTSVVGGITTDTTQVFGGIEYTYNSAILASDRSVASYSIQQLNAHGGNGSGAPPSYFSSNFANVSGIGDEGVQIFNSNPLAAGAPGFGTAGPTPGPIALTPNNTAAQDAELAAGGYIPTSTIPSAVNGVYRLNTTQFGTFAFTPQEREQAFANFGQSIYKDTVQFFATFLFNHDQAESNLAPQPAPLTADGVVVPADNPFNPFGFDINGANGVNLDAAGNVIPVTIKYRFIDAGNRLSTQTDNYYHFVTGIKGDFGLGTGGGDKDYHYSTSFGYDEEDSQFVNSNYINTNLFQEALNGTLPTNPGVFYDPFGNAPTNASLVPNFKDNEITLGTADLMEIHVDLSATPSYLMLPGGQAGFGAGAEYRVESLDDTVDGVTQSGGQLGANATSNFPNEQRITGSFYLEANIPIVGPDMHVPGIHSLDVDASGRAEGIENGAESTIFRVAANWQPYDDEFTVRANFSQSFAAPTLFALYGPTQQTFAAVNLPGGGGEPAGTYQEAFNLLSGPTANSTAQNWGVGAVYSPKQLKGLTVSLDYYNVIYNTPTTQNFQTIVNSINDLGPASPYIGQAHTGTPITGPDQLYDANFASLDVFPSNIDVTQKTQGVDANINYVLPWTKYGTITVGATATYLINFFAQDFAGGPYTNYAGTYSDTGNLGGGAQGLLPHYQINPYAEYDYGGFTYNISCQYIPAIRDLGDSEPNGGFNDYSLDGQPYQVGDYYNLDMSASYEFGVHPPGGAGSSDPSDPKDAKGGGGMASLSHSGEWYDTLKLTFGVNNVTDTQVPFIPSSSNDNTASGTYDIIGRFFFFQVSKKF